MKNIIISTFLQVLLVTAISAAVSFFVVKKMASDQDENQKILVVRTTDVQKGVANLNDPAQQKTTAARTPRLNARITHEVESGAIVIDADSVLRAPESSFIGIQDDATESSKKDEKESEK